MRKSSRIVIPFLLFLFVIVFIPACKDDEPVPPAKISFAESTMTVKEDADIIEIEIVLDKPVKEDITVEYTLKGTALDKVASANNYDYEILSDYLEVNIDKGETTGVIQIQLYSDFDFEDDETIQIEIDNVDSEAVEITHDDDIEITIEQEDGLIVLLDWTYTTVDMDLFLWIQNNGSLALSNLFSAQGGSAAEYLFLPNILNDGQYGISCNYYSGPATLDPMLFTVQYIKIVNGTDVSTVTKNGSYGPGNINPWDDATLGIDPILVATYTKTGSNYSNFSEIIKPSAGSRVGSGILPPAVKKNSKPSLRLPN